MPVNKMLHSQTLTCFYVNEILDQRENISSYMSSMFSDALIFFYKTLLRCPFVVLFKPDCELTTKVLSPTQENLNFALHLHL